MSMKVTRVEGLKFKAEHQGHTIIAGRVDDQHQQEGMSPGAVMIAGLGLCTASRVIEQMMKRGWEAGGIEVTVRTKVSKDLNMATDFEVDIMLEASLTEGQRQEMLAEAQRCFVGNTLKGSPRFTYDLRLV